MYFTSNLSVDKDKQKRHLACMMAYGKDMPATPHGPKILHRPRREPQPIETADLLNDRKLPIFSKKKKNGFWRKLIVRKKTEKSFLSC